MADDEKAILEKRKKNLYLLFAIVSVILFFLIGRLYYIQIVMGKEYGSQGFNQWFKVIDSGTNRGIIYDRNMIPLTGMVKEDYLIIDRNTLDEETISLLEKVCDIEKEDLIKKANNSTYYLELKIENYDEEILENLISNSGIINIERKKRYMDSSIANHVIGYINKDNMGESGLERFFNEELRENREYKLGAVVDAKGDIIPGYGYYYFENPKEKKNIVTTLDYKLQNIIEKIADEHKMKGSVVVLNRDGDILSMVSRPNFNQRDVSKHFDSKENELFNKAIQINYPPGSIFKIVVAAAALEDEKLDLGNKFFCQGYEKLGENIIKCHKYDVGGHGELTFEEAFIESCNSVFIQIGQSLKGNSLIDMAKKLGLGEKTGIPYDGELAGVLPTNEYIRGPGIGNISIGQGTLEVTPLQIARMTNIMINNGIDKGVRLVDKIVNDEGDVIKVFDKSTGARVLSTETARKILDMMEGVVKAGTGTKANIDDMKIGGKTGSAEAWSRGGSTVHGWFTGYYMGQKSNYSITILFEEGGSGGLTAAPIFKDIVISMDRYGY